MLRSESPRRVSAARTRRNLDTNEAPPLKGIWFIILHGGKDKGGVFVNSLIRFGVAVPSTLLEEFDSFIERKGMPNRSEALRQLIRERLSREMWVSGSGVVYGTVTMMYDHHGKDVVAALTALQHEYGESIICTTHVHVDHHHCLECIVLKGDAGEIRRFVEALGTLKGVKSIEPSISAIL